MMNDKIKLTLKEFLHIYSQDPSIDNMITNVFNSSEQALSSLINSNFGMKCFFTISGAQILTLENYKIVQLINQTTATAYSNSKYGSEQEDFGYYISYLPKNYNGINILAAHNYRLANMVTKELLASEKTNSFALNLVNSDDGINLLLSDGCDLIAKLDRSMAEKVIAKIKPAAKFSSQKRRLISTLEEMYLRDNASNVMNTSSSSAAVHVLPVTQNNHIYDDDLASFIDDWASLPSFSDVNMNDLVVTDDFFRFIPPINHSSSSSNDVSKAAVLKPKMAIAPKYFSGETVVSVYQKNNNAKEHPEYRTNLFHNTHEQLSLSLFSSSSHNNNPIFSSKIKSHVMDLEFYNAASKKELDNNDQCFFIMAGRGEHALLPLATNKSRVIIVCTRTEYAQLSRPSLQKSYDFLVINGVPALPQQRLEAITTRRRAALHFAYLSQLSSIVMMDDNITNFKLSLSVALENPTDTIYETLLNEQVVTNEPIISISTESSLTNRNHQAYLGSKVFFINMNQLREKLPKEADLLALLPLNTSAWGEDYLMQLCTHRLFSPQQKGWHVIESDIIQLIRSKADRNACKKTGMKAAKLDDVLIESLFSSPETAYIAKLAIQHFNQMVTECFQAYKVREQEHRTYDYAKEHATSLGLPVDAIDGAINSDDQSLQARLLHMIENNSLVKPFYPHQKEALTFLSNELVKYNNTSQQHYTFNMATGTGKTLVQACLAFQRFLSEPEKNVIAICPSIVLVNQMHAEFIRYGKELFSLQDDYSAQLLPRVLAVCTDKISIQEFENNASLQNRAHIFIMCAASARALLESKPDVFSNTSLIMYDESHLLVKDAELQTLQTMLTTSIPTLHFSATPKLSRFSGPQFNYTRVNGIHDGVLAPLVIDDSLNKLLTANQISHLLCNHPHPNKGPLSAHKGIIYVKQISDAQSLYAKLKEQHPDLNVFEIHSKSTRNMQDIATFKRLPNGLAIAVEMLIEGFDNCNLDWIIINKDVKSDARSQMIGRVTRKDNDIPNKIGLAILLNKSNQIDPEESTFPDGLNNPYNRNVTNTLNYDKAEKEIDDSVHIRADSWRNSPNPINTNVSAFFQPRLPFKKRRLEISTEMTIQEACASKILRLDEPWR